MTVDGDRTFCNHLKRFTFWFLVLFEHNSFLHLQDRAQAKLLAIFHSVHLLQGTIFSGHLHDLFLVLARLLETWLSGAVEGMLIFTIIIEERSRIFHIKHQTLAHKASQFNTSVGTFLRAFRVDIFFILLAV